MTPQVSKDTISRVPTLNACRVVKEIQRPGSAYRRTPIDHETATYTINSDRPWSSTYDVSSRVVNRCAAGGMIGRDSPRVVHVGVRERVKGGSERGRE